MPFENKKYVYFQCIVCRYTKGSIHTIYKNIVDLRALFRSSWASISITSQVSPSLY